MKKLICVLLVVCTVLGLCACGGSGSSGEEKMEGLHVGYAKVDMTPNGATPLGGYGGDTNRLSNKVLDKVYATCIALTDGGETVLMISTDLLKSMTDWTAAVRQKVTAQTGIPGDRVLISATHTHSAPSTSVNTTGFKDLYINSIVKACVDALADRAPATISSTKKETEGFTFVRHYKFASGNVAGDNFGDRYENGMLGHAQEGDEEMILVKFDRGNAKDPILLCNFQSHPANVGTEDKNAISADFVGFTRKIVEDESNYKFIYFTGAAGNQNPSSRVSSEKDYTNTSKFSQAFAEVILEAAEECTPVEGSGVKTVQNKYTYASKKDELDKVEAANKILALNSAGKTDEAAQLMAQYKINSDMHCNTIIAQPGRPATYTMELNAVYVAGIAFITAPYEMFSVSGTYIKENSPFDTTIICSLANEHWNYFASKEAFEYNSYEANTGFFAKGVAEDTANEFVKMLESLK